MACGADRETLISDYVVSREYNKENLKVFLAAHPEIDKNIVLANEKSMSRFIELFTGRFGTVENYFEALGLSSQYAEKIKIKLMR
jgi:protein-tyrosine phosphatase